MRGQRGDQRRRAIAVDRPGERRFRHRAPDQRLRGEVQDGDGTVLTQHSLQARLVEQVALLQRVDIVVKHGRRVK